MSDTSCVRRFSLGIVAIMLTSVVASAQAPRGGGPGPVLGIVEIPLLFSSDPAKGDDQRGVIGIFSRPDPNGRIVAEITSPQAIDEAEYAYEEAGALVYGRARGYCLIRTSRGVGWVSPDQAGPFHSLETLVKNELAYLTRAWDGFVHDSPGSARRTPVNPQRSTQRTEARDVRVRQARSVSGTLWLDVEILSGNVCVSNAPPVVKARGWIRAHDAAGAPTVWFPSRGC